MSPSGKAPDFDSGIRRFESCHPSHDPLAQSAEHLPFKQGVRSSNLRRVTKQKNTSDASHPIFFCFREETPEIRIIQSPNCRWQFGTTGSKTGRNLNICEADMQRTPAGHQAKNTSDAKHPISVSKNCHCEPRRNAGSLLRKAASGIARPCPGSSSPHAAGRMGSPQTSLSWQSQPPDKRKPKGSTWKGSEAAER